MTDPILTEYQLKIWKRNMPSIIRQLRGIPQVAMKMEPRACVLSTSISVEPFYWRSEEE